ncbi:hypothetical protein AU467_19665 [Mesorhizobium loti]|uniref:Uncharacterized protein n=1 Tax=Rhizobium loti TaxID=381 RepID=A0A124GGG9_RHILI|nr:hypothetical protein AU467_19665 [Mesorhizobium loti]
MVALPVQVRHHQESTELQYRLVDRAVALGWPHERVQFIDEDLGKSGAGTVERVGFKKLIAEIGLGNAGLVISLDAFRLARNNRDWQILVWMAVAGLSVLNIGGLRMMGFNGLILQRRPLSAPMESFFERPAALAKPGAQGAAADTDRPLDCQPLDHLVQRDVLALIDQPDDEGFMRIEHRTPPPTLRPGRSLADLGTCDPTDCTRHSNRAAACRADIPSSEAFKTRDRRSSLSALAIIHLIKVDVESAGTAAVTSQSIHRSMDSL